MDRNKTSFYVTPQLSKGTPVAPAAGDAIELTYDSAVFPFVVRTNKVDRNNITTSRLPQQTVVTNTWGETPGDLVIELHGGNAAAPEFGVLMKSLLGAETSAGNYSIDDDGDATWYTVTSFVDNAKMVGTDARTRAWSYSATVDEVITQSFRIVSLSAAESVATDALTPVYDNQTPMVGACMTVTAGGTSVSLRSAEFTVENPTIINYATSCTYDDLPEGTPLSITGSIVIKAENVAAFTSALDNSVADIIITAIGGGATNVVTLLDCEYAIPEVSETDRLVEYSIPFVATGGVTSVFS